MISEWARTRPCAAVAIVGIFILIQGYITSSYTRPYGDTGETRHALYNLYFDVPSKISGLYGLTGAITDVNGVYENFTVDIKVSLIHSFSPAVEERFRSMMVDPYSKQHRIYANSPAILQLDNHTILTVLRIWLDKEVWQKAGFSPTNVFSDNYFYIQTYDQQMKPVSKGRILGIPTPVNFSVGDGPLEPRVFRVNDTTYLTFNTALYANKLQLIDSTFLWDLTNQRAIIPYIEGGNPMINQKKGWFVRDKHWSALINDTQLYFVYNLDPLKVMTCSLQTFAACHFLKTRDYSESWTFNDYTNMLRGGTPFVKYRYPYYLTIAHGTAFTECMDTNSPCYEERIYTSHLVVLSVEPEFRILYVSDDIPLPVASLNVPMVRYRFISHSFFFPVGLVLENDDSLVVGGHINDHSSVLFRIQGISTIVERTDSYLKNNRETKGPPTEYLHKHLKKRLENSLGYKLKDGNDNPSYMHAQRKTT